jgi:hypothetical protein
MKRGCFKHIEHIEHIGLRERSYGQSHEAMKSDKEKVLATHRLANNGAEGGLTAADNARGKAINAGCVFPNIVTAKIYHRIAPSVLANKGQTLHRSVCLPFVGVKRI